MTTSILIYLLNCRFILKTIPFKKMNNVTFWTVSNVLLIICKLNVKQSHYANYFQIFHGFLLYNESNNNDITIQMNQRSLSFEIKNILSL